MKVEELRTEGRVYRRCFSRLGTAVVGRANAGGTTTAVRKMRGRSGLHVPRAQGALRGQGLACVEGHRGRVCFPCGGGSRLGGAVLGKVFCRRCFLAAGCVFSWGGLQGWDTWRWVRFCDVGVFWPRGVFSVGRFTRLGCAVPGASWGRPDGICAPVQAKFQKLSRKPSKGSLCGAVSACEQRWPSGVKVEVFIVGGDL